MALEEEEGMMVGVINGAEEEGMLPMVMGNSRGGGLGEEERGGEG